MLGLAGDGRAVHAHLVGLRVHAQGGDRGGEVRGGRDTGECGVEEGGEAGVRGGDESAQRA